MEGQLPGWTPGSWLLGRGKAHCLSEAERTGQLPWALPIPSTGHSRACPEKSVGLPGHKLKATPQLHPWLVPACYKCTLVTEGPGRVRFSQDMSVTAASSSAVSPNPHGEACHCWSRAAAAGVTALRYSKSRNGVSPRLSSSSFPGPGGH